MRAGATDFLVRPVAPERLLEALAANADRRRGSGELAPVSEKLAPALSLEQLVGAAPEFRASLAIAAKAARNRLPILIVGEPGTGKETFARAIHAASLRARGPLLTVDCKAVPANIIDSELFGHEKGAFPGAFAAKIGKISKPTAALCCSTRSPHCPPKPRSCSTACSPPAKCGRWAQRQQFGRRAGHRDEPAAPCRKISTPAWPSGSARPRSPCRRCATGAATFPSSPAICLPASASRPG